MAAGLGLVVLALGTGWLWLRDSPLVAVQRVQVSGLNGPDAGAIRASLTAAARGMTTLDVQLSRLQSAVSAYPVVRRLRVSTAFPHTMRIRVEEEVPVAVVELGSRTVPVAADGTLLPDGGASEALPLLTLRAAPGGTRVQDPVALAELSVLAAAPPALVAHLTSVSSSYWHGVTVQIRRGPAVYFGPSGLEAAKWQAALKVLSSPATAGARYVDVSQPSRPAAGAAG